MATVEEVARHAQAIADAGKDVALPLIAKWVGTRYKELCSRADFRHLRNATNLYYAVPLTAGTVSVTLGSNQVVGTGTAFSPAQTGWYLRVYTNWYVVQQVSGQTLYLDTPFTETTSTSATYIVLQRNLPVDAQARKIDTVYHARLFRPLKERSLRWMNLRNPTRILVAPAPEIWCEGPAYRGEYATPGKFQKTIEIYPPSTIAEQYPYVWFKIPPVLEMNDEIPAEIDLDVLRDGALVDLYDFRSNRAATQNPPDKDNAMFYANIASRQRTIWAGKIEEAQRTDKGADDEDVELWNPKGDIVAGEVPAEYDNQVSRLGIITVQ